MSRREHETKRAPIGCNDSADPSLIPQQRASIMLGLSSFNPGSLNRALWNKIVQADIAPSGLTITGIFQYNGDNAAADKIMVVKGRALYTCQVSGNAPQTTPDSLNFTSTALVAVTNSTGITNVFTADKRVRAVQHKNEMIFVQEGGLQPVRYNGTALFKLGVTAPAAPTVDNPGAGTGLNGVYTYYVTYADELGRESSPSPATVKDTAGAIHSYDVHLVASADPQVQRIYVYRSVAGVRGPLLPMYRILNAGYANANATVTDTITDTNLPFMIGGPSPFQNEVPAPASLLTIYKNRLVLNNTSDREGIQVSNLDQPGSFSLNGPSYNANGALANPNDGLTFRVINEFGDEITGLRPIGSALGIWNRRTFGVLMGDNPGNFLFRQVNRRGCIAPDSIATCNNEVWFMGEDALYSISFESGFQAQKVSEDLDGQFRGAAVRYDVPGNFPFTRSYSKTDRAAAAIAWFMQNRYYLAVPPYVLIRDLTTGGWSLDYMTGMVDALGLSNGYLSGSVIFADRQFEAFLYSPGIGASTPIGNMWVASWYPLKQTAVGVDEPFSFVYETRGFDGAGVHRGSLKRPKRFTLFGEILPAVNTDGSISATAKFSGTVYVDCDGQYVESYPFDNISQGGTNFIGANFARDQAQGKLIVQEFTPKAQGRVLKIGIKGTANGRLAVRDASLEYVRLDGPS